MLNTEYNNKVIEMLSNAKQAFIEHKNTVQICGEVYLLETFIDRKKYKVFGLKKNNQYDINYNDLRTVILQKLLNKNDGQIIEVIGDSTKFDFNGSQFAKKHFAEEMESFSGILLYGYTGQEDIEQGLVDVNGLVNSYIDEHPSFADMVLANVVDFDTRVALGEVNQPVPTIPECTGWGAVVSGHVRNFFLVWDNTCSKGALFGDDTFVSDKLVNSKALLYAGGLQSFLQATNILNYGFQVVGIAGIRGKNNPATFIKGHGYDKHVDFFETALFFNMIKSIPNVEMNSEEIIALKNSYVVTDEKPDLTETRALLLNPFRSDLSLRLSLWHQGWKNFINHETWRNIKNDLYVACSSSVTSLSNDFTGFKVDPKTTTFSNHLNKNKNQFASVVKTQKETTEPCEDINKNEKFCFIL